MASSGPLAASGVTPPGFLRRRLLTPLLVLLKQGATPRRLAWSVALGVGMGLFPIFGTTTFLCAFFCAVFRLNQPASQLANHVMYPIQVPMILVFVRLGERLSGAPLMPFHPGRLAAEWQAGPAAFLQRFGATALHGVLGWLVVVPMVVGAVYLVLLPILRTWAERRGREALSSQP